MKFSEYVKEYKPEKIENDFENIVLQFIEKEREGKPLSWNTSKPFVSKDKAGKPTGDGFIKYIPLETFKEKLEGNLSKPLIKQKDVIAYYRKTYIEKALKIDNVNDIYKKLTTGEPDVTYNSTLQSQYNRAYYTLAVRELIRFEKYLNEVKEPQPETEKKKPGRESVEVKEATEYLQKFDFPESKVKFLNALKEKYADATPKTFNHVMIALNELGYLKPASKNEYRLSFEKALNREAQSKANFNKQYGSDPDLTIYNSIKINIDEIIQSKTLA